MVTMAMPSGGGSVVVVVVGFLSAASALSEGPLAHAPSIMATTTVTKTQRSRTILLEVVGRGIVTQATLQ
jgi:hypothetical protein